MEGHPNTSILNIDHHADRLKETPLPYAENMLQIISPDASSTAEILVVEQNLETPILYVGLATDTLFFKVGHVGAAMQAVMDLHLDDKTITTFRNNLDVQYTIEQIKNLLNSQVYYYDSHKLLIIAMTVIDGELNINLINLTRCIDFVAIIQPNGSCSLRTSRDVDLSVFAKKFKGGGHPQAAGCKVEMDKIDEFITEYKKFISFFTTKFPPIPSEYVTKVI
jgi:nanoRNase/pAp phosphatase (c-di-AMP/oligoRNAs hydrolase)